MSPSSAPDRESVARFARCMTTGAWTYLDVLRDRLGEPAALDASAGMLAVG